jgi:UDP-N-acetylglucosamine--N-acetylmuramyl-(pentapeptide) pyrophosphoryl-undecaprenol N-acetylglucosamine transferase
MTVRRHILIMAGGTGGHIIPGLAVAEELIGAGHQVSWLGSQQGLENDLVPAAGIALHTVPASGLRGGSGIKRLLGPLRMAKAVLMSWRLLAVIRPDAVLSMGGFAAAPGGVAAWLRRLPLVVHEQNAVAGYTNRLLARLAKAVFSAFPNTFPARRKEITCGNPVRTSIEQLPKPERRFRGREQMRLLVLGGSQGALALNQRVIETLAKLPPSHRPMVIHQAGRRHEKAVRAAYREADVQADVRGFIEDMPAVYGWADLAIARAGALTLSEFTAAGLGAILVPYPHAVDDHQAKNAEHLVQAGAALCVTEAELSVECLIGMLQPCLASREKCLDMAERAHALARPGAAQAVAERCLNLANQALEVRR